MKAGLAALRAPCIGVMAVLPWAALSPTCLVRKELTAQCHPFAAPNVKVTSILQIRQFSRIHC